jgi:hypothetical protein
MPDEDPRFAVAVLGRKRVAVNVEARKRVATAARPKSRANAGRPAVVEIVHGRETLLVNSHAALAAISATSTTYPAIVSYGAVADDGGGGVFIPNAARVNENNGGTVLDGWVRQFSGPADARWFGAKGDGSTADHAAITAALAAHDHVELRGTHRISANVTIAAGKTLHASAGSISVDAGVVVQIDGEIAAGARQIFSGAGTVRIGYRLRREVLPEWFGAEVLSDPHTGTEDSTAALQTMFASLQGATYNSDEGYSPGMYDGSTIVLGGVYGISDTISVNVGSHRIVGNGPVLTGSGLKWIGAAAVANATKSMLKLYGAQGARIEGLVFLGVKTTDDTKRLFAMVESVANPLPEDWVAPFTGEWPRGVVISGCMFGDQVGFFTQSGSGTQAQRAITTSGALGNNDFFTIENCQITNVDDAIVMSSAQNVYWKLSNLRVTAVTNSVVWQQLGGQLLVERLYVGSLPGTASVMRVGHVDNVAAPDSQVHFLALGGEVNAMQSFVHNEQAATTTLRWSFDETELSLAGVNFQTGTQCLWQLSFTNGLFLNSIFTISNDSVGNRCTLKVVGSRGLSSVAVVNTTTLASLDVTVENCWGGPFSPPPSALQSAGRNVATINYRKRFVPGTASTALDAASLYATAELLADRLDVGDPMFGAVARLSSRTFMTETLAASAIDVPCLPASGGILMFGCTILALDSDYLQHSNSANSCLMVGDSLHVERYGRKYGSTGNSRSFYPLDHTDDAARVPPFAPFATFLTNVRITGGYYTSGVSTWAATTVTAPSGNFVASLVGCTWTMTSGDLDGLSAVILSVDSTKITVSVSRTGSGIGVALVPLAAGKRIQVTPLYLDPFSNSADVIAHSGASQLYAQPVASSAV